jgi:hypothetical protein
MARGFIPDQMHIMSNKKDCQSPALEEFAETHNFGVMAKSGPALVGLINNMRSKD